MVFKNYVVYYRHFWPFLLNCKLRLFSQLNGRKIAHTQINFFLEISLYMRHNCTKLLLQSSTQIMDFSNHYYSYNLLFYFIKDKAFSYSLRNPFNPVQARFGCFAFL